MNLIHKLNQKLDKMFNGAVHAREENGCVVLTGSLDSWEDIVKAGYLAVNKKRYYGVINDIEYTKEPIPGIRLPDFEDSVYDDTHCDIAIIGAGIIGCSIARELARYKLKILLIDKEHDVGMHASSRNDGEIHPGIDLIKGQVKQKFNIKGNEMYDRVSKELDFKFYKPGQYLCFDDKRLKFISSIARLYWRFMKIPTIYLNKNQLKERIDGISEKMEYAVFFPTAGVVSPYEVTIAYAENACDNGVRIALDTAVTNMEVSQNNIISLKTNRGTIYPKLVINAAGAYADKIAGMAQDRFYTIHARKGTNAIFDKKTVKDKRYIVSTYGMSKVKTVHSKGGGIITTADDNMLIGPDAYETFDREDFSTDGKNIDQILQKHRRTLPNLKKSDIIAYYSGIRAATYEEDFVITEGKRTKNIIHVAGIQSPGLTAAPAIAEYVSRMAYKMLSKSILVELNNDFNPIRKAIPDLSKLNEEERDRLIKMNPDYGVIVCRCEEISLGQIKDALTRSVPCDTLDGVKRRVRAGMGRCQGGFCGPLVLKTIAQVKKMDYDQVAKKDDQSRILFGKTKKHDTKV
ncbi:MAG TPA: NAD(P)/FAD-dependent oxidoreductase [Clostridia bacterium]|nr:MAG: Hydrogen cyanide synthase subunit HcnC precursor [Firmicutes bacterium ADurb.Bin146]HOD93776.1 NAD(P)/FAD-dependent oxidoreductase [Clostridia bacterium]HQM39113.1 NAD(P)/FAD-dependent oxidoreductase [Clostridia bacterium]